MNKIVKCILPLAAALCLLLCACSKNAAAPFEPTAAANALKESDAFSEALEEMDKETAALYYGLDEAAIKDSAVYGSLSAGAEEIAVLVLTDEAAANSAKERLQSHLEDQKQALKDYQPQEVAKLDAAILEQRGSSLLLAVAADAAKAQKVIDGLS